MDTDAQKINLRKKPISYGPNWHYEILPRQTKKALMFLSEEKWLKESYSALMFSILFLRGFVITIYKYYTQFIYFLQIIA